MCGQRPVRRPMVAAAAPFPTLLFALAAAASAGAEATRFQAVVEANPVREDIACGYTTTSTSSEQPDETRVERYSPDDGWRLLAVDGDEPSAEALAAYAKEAEQRSNQRQQPQMFDLAAVARRDTVRVAEEDAESVTFAFTPDGDESTSAKEREMMEQMQGTLVVARTDQRPRRLVVELLKPASPMPTVKVHEFRQEFVFAVDPATDALLLSSLDFAMRGKAFVFKKFHQEMRIAFSDYDCRATRTNALPSINDERPTAGE